MASGFVINIEPEALTDIQDAVDYYKQIRSGLGEKFFNSINRHFKILKKNPNAFAIRYDDVRCLPIRKFPYMIHYKVLEEHKQISIKAIFCTHQNPQEWDARIQS